MMSKLNSTTLNALRTLFGARAASRLFKQSRGRASHILEEARASYGAGWDAIRAVHALMEQAFLETPASEVIDSPTRAAPFLQTRLAGLGYEVFAVLFLDLCRAGEDVEFARNVATNQSDIAGGLHISQGPRDGATRRPRRLRRVRGPCAAAEV